VQAILRHHGLDHPQAALKRLRACDPARESSSTAFFAASFVPAASSTTSTPSSNDPSCPLRVAFVVRRAHRRLTNLDALLQACRAWQPVHVASVSDRAYVHCDTVSFGDRAAAVHAPIHNVDILVTPHGSDVINALKMHAGASLVEIMPIHRRACPCSDLKDLIRTENQIRHYRLFTDVPSYASGAAASGMDADLMLPWGALAAVLDDITAHEPGDESADGPKMPTGIT
jgi:hypothetical protein